MQAIETGHTDTDDTTVLHVPAIGLVVAGDVAYNGVHQYLLESGGAGIEAWLQAIDKVAALRPRAVVAGHKNKDLPDDPAILDETRAYLLDAQRLLADKPSPLEFYEQMLAGYPDRLNLGPLWYGARWDCSADPANHVCPSSSTKEPRYAGPALCALWKRTRMGIH